MSLHDAARSGELENVMRLAEGRADVNGQDSVSQRRVIAAPANSQVRPSRHQVRRRFVAVSCEQPSQSLALLLGHLDESVCESVG